MATLDLSHLVTLIAGAALAGGGFLLRRMVTGAHRQESVTLYAGLTEIAAKMKANGLSSEDVAAIETFAKGKSRERLMLSDKPPTPSLTSNEPDGYWTQFAMNEREAAALATAEAQLMEALTDLQHYLGDGLWEVQKAWQTFRAAQADLAAEEFQGGSIAPLIRASEARSLTEQRLAWARAQIDVMRNR